MLSRYLGPDETRWDTRFRRYLHDDPAERGTVWLRLSPTSLTATDLSYRGAAGPTRQRTARCPETGFD